MCDWGYCSHNGPTTWHQNYPIAKEGLRQSPINITASECELDTELQNKPLTIEYETRGKMIFNTGAGWKVNLNNAISLLEGGPLEGKYRLEQFHCHWGMDKNSGSEHTVNGMSYPAELHLVHWNSTKYSSFGEAVDKDDGLAVLGIFLEVGDEPHPEIGKICELLSRIPHSGDNCPIETDLDPVAFIPDKRSYWTYPGSLTTPPLLESVTWIVFKQPIQISEDQLNSFRSLLSYGRLDRVPNDEFEGKILTNYRPALEKNAERVVKNCDMD